jgi:putative tryptophan/tyrosine transport system substrate-binding protein
VNRRAFVTGLGAVLAAPLAVEAQQASRVYRLGILSPAPPSLDVISVPLREVGYVEGQNLTIERRYGAGNPASLPRLARELVQLRLDAIVAVGADSIKAAKEATRTVPIVMGFTADPVALGFVSSLSRPGGNITGVAYAVGPEIAAKRVELLREAVPKITRMGILSTHETASQPQVQHAWSAGARLGVELIAVDAENNNYDAAFAALVAERVGAVFVVGSLSLLKSHPPQINLHSAD